MTEVTPFLYMRLNFLMAKKIYISYENLKEVLVKKVNNLGIKKNDWTVFTLVEDVTIGGSMITKYYKELNELKKLILNEVSIAKETFNNFQKSILDYISRNHLKEKQENANFFEVLNEDIKINEEFEKIYVETLREFLKEMKTSVLKIEGSLPAGKNLAYLIDEMWILTDTNFFKLGDNEYVNLQRFYELRRQSDISDILERITEAYNHFNL